jgi:hypothetical protein
VRRYVLASLYCGFAISSEYTGALAAGGVFVLATCAASRAALFSRSVKCPVRQHSDIAGSPPELLQRCADVDPDYCLFVWTFAKRQARKISL